MVILLLHAVYRYDICHESLLYSYEHSQARYALYRFTRISLQQNNLHIISLFCLQDILHGHVRGFVRRRFSTTSVHM